MGVHFRGDIFFETDQIQKFLHFSGIFSLTEGPSVEEVERAKISGYDGRHNVASIGTRPNQGGIEAPFVDWCPHSHQVIHRHKHHTLNWEKWPWLPFYHNLKINRLTSDELLSNSGRCKQFRRAHRLEELWCKNFWPWRGSNPYPP